jgi:hypothetical protein
MATTTPNYGWDVPTSTDYVKDGATAIETLGDDIDATLYTALGGAYPGLCLVKKQTIGSAVSSVTVTSAFTATYENYLIHIVGGVGSTNNTLLLTLGSTATGYYYAGKARNYAGVDLNVQNANAAAWYGAEVSTNTIDGTFNIQSPFTAKNTVYSGNCVATRADGYYLYQSGYLANTTSYTAFTFTTSGAGTITGGTVYVYGYGAS